MKLSEKQIETMILTYLSMCRGFLCYKLNNTGIYDPKIKKFRKVQNKFIPKGPSDIFGTYYSRSVYIEVKTPEEYAYLIKHYEELRIYVGKCKTKNHLKDQIRFIESNSALGCIAFFTCSLDMTKTKLQEFLRPVDRMNMQVNDHIGNMSEQVTMSLMYPAEVEEKAFKGLAGLDKVINKAYEIAKDYGLINEDDSSKVEASR